MRPVTEDRLEVVLQQINSAFKMVTERLDSLEEKSKTPEARKTITRSKKDES